jgi:hypothetical protein
MANASIELSWVTPVGQHDSLFAHAIRQETLAISGTTATMATAVAAADLANTSVGEVVARICTDDTGCYFARGVTPDPTATAQVVANSGALTTSARRWIPAGGEFVTKLAIGEKIAVHS